MPQSCDDLEVYRLAHRLAVEAHSASLQLPRIEQYEEASQLRRAAKAVPANIVEGYGRRRYKAEFIRFLVIAHASCEETIEHLRLLKDTGSLAPESFARLAGEYDVLARKLNRFIASVESSHQV